MKWHLKVQLQFIQPTMAPEENENVISQILDEEDIDLKKININGLKLDNGVTNWKEEDYNKEVKNVLGCGLITMIPTHSS